MAWSQRVFLTKGFFFLNNVQYNGILLMILSLVWRHYSTSIEERRDGHTAHQILQKQTLPSYKDGNKRSQGVVER